MKHREGFIVKEVAGDYVLVPLGENMMDFREMMSLNETGAFLWEQLEKDTTEEALLDAMTSEYEVERALAQEDLTAFLDTLRARKLLEE